MGGRSPPSLLRGFGSASPSKRDGLEVRRIRNKPNQKSMLCICIYSVAQTHVIRLTELFKQHFGVFELHTWFATKTRFGHETGPEKSSRADLRCTRLLIALRVFFVSTGTLGLRSLGGRTSSSVLTGPKRMVLGQVWMTDNFGEQQVLVQVLSNICPSQNGCQMAGFN